LANQRRRQRVAQSAHHILAFFRSLQTERKARAPGAAVDAGLAVTRSGWLICTTVMFAWFAAGTCPFEFVSAPPTRNTSP
jgi:hypothetical protein